MTMVVSRLARQVQETVLDHLQVKTAAYSMLVTDTLVKCDTSTAAFTLTLPSVSEAVGVPYTIKMTAGAGSGAAPNNLTITTKSGPDASRWNGDVLLRRPGQNCILISDGEEWHVLRIKDGAPFSGNQVEKYMHEMFLLPLNMCAKGVVDLGDAPTGVTGDENVIFCGSGNIFEQHVIVTQTLTGPIWVDPGVNIAQDLTDNDGVEWTTGIGANSRHRFTVGTDPAFFARCRFTIADVSGTDDCLFGFRRRTAYQAAIDDYEDVAAFNIGLGAAGRVNLATALNSGSMTETDTTNTDWADGETHSLEIRVSGAGVVTYLYDDAAPTTVAAFTFDDTDDLIPFFHFIFATTSPGAITLLEFECGLQN